MPKTTIATNLLGRTINPHPDHVWPWKKWLKKEFLDEHGEPELYKFFTRGEGGKLSKTKMTIEHLACSAAEIVAVWTLDGRVRISARALGGELEESHALVGQVQDFYLDEVVVVDEVKE